MRADRLATFAHHAVAFDTETHRVQPGLLAPPIVCASVAYGHAHCTPALLDRDEARELFADLLDDPNAIIVGANVAFDMLVMAVDAARRGVNLMPAIFQAYRDERVFDVQIAEALHAIAEGHLGKRPDGGNLLNEEGKVTNRYSLSNCVMLVLDRTNAKANDKWRQSYALLENTPIDQWPTEARTYPVDDAVNTLEVALAQVKGQAATAGHRWGTGETCLDCGYEITFSTSPPCPANRAGKPRRNLHDHAMQVYKAWALHLGASWGIRADGESVEALAAAATKLASEGLEEFKAAGFVRPDGSEDGAVVKRAVAIAYGASGRCPTCAGTGKIYNKFSKRDPSKPIGKPINCKDCSATGLDLSTAPVPMTEPSETFPSGQVQSGRDILIESGDEQLMEYGASLEDEKILSTYVPFLREGVSAPICLRPNPVLDTGRVSYSGPIQLLPRAVSARLGALLREMNAPIVGVRDCFRARGPQYEVIEVPDDYVLQPGEEIVP